MSEMKHGHPHTEFRGEGGDHRPYWQRVHHDWKFWVALLLMLVAMAVYVRSNNLSLRPNAPAQQPIP